MTGVFRVKDLKFNGTLKDLAVNGKIEGTEGAVRYGKTFQKPAGMPLTLTADARYAATSLLFAKASLGFTRWTWLRREIFNSATARSLISPLIPNQLLSKVGIKSFRRSRAINSQARWSFKRKCAARWAKEPCRRFRVC